jgi:hypothetical protein
MGFFNDIYTLYTPKERRNIGMYILGIMLYKFGLESVCIYLCHMSSTLSPLK